jgi:hypothetical protein
MPGWARWAIVLAAVFLAGYSRTRSVDDGWILTAVVGFVLWLGSVWLTPFRTCRSCKGTGRQRGFMSTWAHRQCPSCAGTGRHRRRNVTMFFGDRLTRGEARAFRARSRRIRPRP